MILRNDNDILEMIKLPLTEYILKRIGELEQDGQPPKTIFATCPNSKISETTKIKFNILIDI